jgi:hypothetical protein
MSAANLVFSNRYGRGSGADAMTGAQETGLRQMSAYFSCPMPVTLKLFSKD